jgi:hypothetical protein
MRSLADVDRERQQDLDWNHNDVNLGLLRCAAVHVTCEGKKLDYDDNIRFRLQASTRICHSQQPSQQQVQVQSES